MKKLFYSLCLLFLAATIQAQTPAITMTTTTAIGSTFTFYVAATANNTPIQMDWGNGTLTNFTIGTSSSDVSGTLTGNTIKVYGVGISELYLGHKKLRALDISGATALKEIYCYSNQLTFSTLPIKRATWVYSYSPQAKVVLQKKNYTLSETIDLSSQLTANGNTTSYIWKTKGRTTLTAGTDYSTTNGVTSFLKAQTDSVYCQMTNATFLDLTLSTTNVKVTQSPVSVNETSLTINIYPNPVKESLNIEMKENITKVEVYTILGAKIAEMQGNNTPTMAIPAASLPKGLLIVKVYSRNGVMERNVLKE